MSRIVFGDRTDRPLSPGVTLDHIAPGGRQGPNREVLAEVPSGRTWMYQWLLGTEEDSFQLAIPDIRMPANQYWPLHWHDCWVAVVILEGTFLCGDWWMQPGDVYIAPAEMEYGPGVPGPSGVHMFEIFAKSHLRQGGYALEYRDHPTVQDHPQFQFKERSALNKRNDGRMVLPNAGIEGVVMGHLTPGAVFDLGDPQDPERGVMLYNALKPGEEIAPHSYGDARAIFVWEGELIFGERTLTKHEVVIIERDAPAPAMKAGPQGAGLLEVVRTAAGLERRPL